MFTPRRVTAHRRNDDRERLKIANFGNLTLTSRVKFPISAIMAPDSPTYRAGSAASPAGTENIQPICAKSPTVTLSYPISRTGRMATGMDRWQIAIKWLTERFRSGIAISTGSDGGQLLTSACVPQRDHVLLHDIDPQDHVKITLGVGLSLLVAAWDGTTVRVREAVVPPSVIS